MKAKFLTCLLLSFLVSRAQPNKPIIDTGSLKIPWPGINDDIIMSNDGKFVAFTINNQPVGYKSLVVQDVENKWKKTLVFDLNSALNFFITTDSKKLCLKNNDSLSLLQFGTGNSTLIGVVSRYIFPPKRKGAWIAYSLTEDQDKLILLNLVTDKKHFFSHVSDAFFDGNGELLALNKLEKENTLQIFNLEKGKSKVIFNCDRAGKLISYQFDETSKHFAFIIQESQNKTVFYYKNGMAEAIKKIDQNDTILHDLTISGIKGFNRNGKWMVVELKKNQPQELKKNLELPSVDVWSYRDMILNPQQLHRDGFSSRNNSVDLAIETSTNYLTLINRDGFKVPGLPSGDHIIISSDTAYEREYWWQHSPQPNDWLLSLKDASRKLLLSEDKSQLTDEISPEGRWVIWWDDEHSSWNSYEILSGTKRNLTQAIRSNFNSLAQYHASVFNQPVSNIAGWCHSDAFLLIYDNYDIWKIDPANKIPPVNLTGGYGRKNKIELRIVYENDFKGDESLLLSGFNQENKLNGFFRIKLNKPGEPELLSMQPFTWFRYFYQGHDGGIKPVKGEEGKNTGYVLKRESATDYPNYYYTKDFKTFKPLTSLAPHRKYNWLTTELVSWNLPMGRTSQGILYKPENFDSTKRYPIIFNYYEKQSYGLFSFKWPGLTSDNINIPWFVSRGYLVFCPDIYYEVGAKTGIPSGEYACMAVESAAKELVKRKYIDSTKMALDGHSFGGLETNYIVTHSKLFAAAAEGSGFTDEMSMYLTLSGNAINEPLDIQSVQSHKERGHTMYGATPWENPKLYLDNSPVWAADKVSTPLLSFHNKRDEQVPWRQGVEMYMALRRLGKPCWMLQYDNGMHTLIDDKDELDYTIRLTQFFDHYLKDAPAPRWMTQGIPAALKQVENRYELDPAGNCGKDCKVCKYWNEKFKKNSTACWKEIGERKEKEHWE